MTKIKNAIGDFFKNAFGDFSVEKAIIRIIIAWLFINLLTVIKIKADFVSAEFAAKVDLPMYLCFIFITFIALCLLGKYRVFTWIETYSPMVLLTVYGYITAKSNANAAYLFGFSVFLAVSVFYAVNKSTRFFDINKKITVIIIYSAVAALFTGYVGAIAVLRYTLYRNPNYDFGIWSQMFYYMRKCFKPLTTCERAEIGLMSHFKVHFSPIYYIYLPFYMIFPYPVTLNILQVITLVSGLVPVYLLCRKKNLSKAATAAFGIMFVAFPAVACGTFYDLHENCFLLPMILWLFYFIEKDSWKGTIIFLLLTLIIKEDAAVYCACIGIYTILGPAKYKKGAFITLFSTGYFLLVTGLMKIYGLGIMDNRFSNYISEAGSGGLIDVIRNFIVNPAYVIEESFSVKKLEFIFLMVFPIGFLPFISKKAASIVLFIPILLENLVSNYQYQYSIFFQYVFGSTAILFYLAIVNYSELSERSRRFCSSFAICMGIMLAPVASLSKSYYFDLFTTKKEECEILDKVMESIPEKASVAASTFFVPHLSNRDYVVEYGYKYNELVDYIIIDTRFNSLSTEEYNKIIDSGYIEKEKIIGVYIIFECEDSIYAG